MLLRGKANKFVDKSFPDSSADRSSYSFLLLSPLPLAGSRHNVGYYRDSFSLLQFITDIQCCKSNGFIYI